MAQQHIGTEAPSGLITQASVLELQQRMQEHKAKRRMQAKKEAQNLSREEERKVLALVASATPSKGISHKAPMPPPRQGRRR